MYRDAGDHSSVKLQVAVFCRYSDVLNSLIYTVVGDDYPVDLHGRVLLDREDTDMTALVSSLAQLILDDYCRTVGGFQDLVDREWTALGHQWVSRYSASSADKVSGEWINL